MSVCALVRGPFEEVVLQGIIRCDSVLGVKVQHSIDKIFEFKVVRDGVPRFTATPTAGSARLYAQDVMQLLGARTLILATVLVLSQHVAVRGGQLVEEFSRLVGLVEQVFRRHAQHFDNFVHLIHLVAATEQRLAGVHLHQNAAQGPHIDCQVVRYAQQDFGGPIES